MGRAAGNTAIPGPSAKLSRPRVCDRKWRPLDASAKASSSQNFWWPDGEERVGLEKGSEVEAEVLKAGTSSGSSWIAGSPGLTIDVAAVDLMARSPKEILTLLGEVGRGEKGKLAMSLEVSGDVNLRYNISIRYGATVYWTRHLNTSSSSSWAAPDSLGLTSQLEKADDATVEIWLMALFKVFRLQTFAHGHLDPKSRPPLQAPPPARFLSGPNILFKCREKHQSFFLYTKAF